MDFSSTHGRSRELELGRKEIEDNTGSIENKEIIYYIALLYAVFYVMYVL
jgi:hypothetical protein